MHAHSVALRTIALKVIALSAGACKLHCCAAVMLVLVSLFGRRVAWGGRLGSHVTYDIRAAAVRFAPGV